MEYEDFKGTSALDTYSNKTRRISSPILERYYVSPMHKKWEFVISQFYLTLNYINDSEIREKEKGTLYSLFRSYYISNLQTPSNLITKKLEPSNYSMSTRNQLKQIEIKLGFID